jgi:hypothetical protein
MGGRILHRDADSAVDGAMLSHITPMSNATPEALTCHPLGDELRCADADAVIQHAGERQPTLKN